MQQQARKDQRHRATTHGPAAEAPLDGAEYDAETEDAAEAPEAETAAAARVRSPRPSNWGAITKTQKRHWFHRHGKWKTDWTFE